MAKKKEIRVKLSAADIENLYPEERAALEAHLEQLGVAFPNSNVEVTGVIEVDDDE